jgi:ornithine decarboxylase
MLSPNLPNFPIRQLIHQQGTPLLLGNRQKIQEQIQLLREEIPNVNWFYAVKANNDCELLTTIGNLGLGFDIASFDEWNRVREACTMLGGEASNGEPPPLLHSHPCKSKIDLSLCYENGIRRFVLDCESEASKIAELAPESECLLRLNVPGKSSTVNFSTRFGAALEQVVPLFDYAKSLKLRLIGLAFHVGSQCTDPSDFEVALQFAREVWNKVAAAGYPLQVLDIGGGFPVSYRDQPVPPIREYCRKIRTSLARCFGDVEAMIIAEPGRIVCAEAVWLVASIIGKQYRNGRCWYTIDDGRYGTFSGKYFSEKCFDFIALEEIHGPTSPSTIVGPTCDGGDIVALDYPLPNLDVGSFLVVPNVGAYCAVGATRFNGMPKAKRVWID